LPVSFGRDAAVGAHNAIGQFAADVASSDPNVQSRAWANLSVGAFGAVLNPGRVMTHDVVIRTEGLGANLGNVRVELQRTGPKTDNRFGHNRTIRMIARQVTAEGDTVIAGGRRFNDKYLPEAIWSTDGGFKSTRRPDLLVMRPDRSQYGINIGRLGADGLPITRELRALHDLSVRGNLPMQFVPYGSK
jgi:hypothetical protein